ncbi:putative PEX23-like peroxisomal biogenesis factor 23-like protein [Podospora fimiseda]|uniref:PEX23-like peroxisomal biogenesis factor 23-like protein n=1 Tax=Podospora fimiseda TaxID=252190 RepID=A0AAN7BV57_9PEZI|nr:putative PEX23-like peroxisomal biogenesis factor 23-like protein [Podospora fimiseda]
MPRIKHHRSSRRVPPPKDSDFDHEINLVDNTDGEDGDSTRPPTAEPSSSSQHQQQVLPPGKPPSLGTVIGQGNTGEGGARLVPAPSPDDPTRPSIQIEEPTPYAQDANRPKSVAANGTDKRNEETPESAIDILYENQRGGFLCGIPLFSSKALGGLDPPAWTNYAHKASPTNINNAQVPDPSWEWAWPEWKINEDDQTDADGWIYAFAFGKKMSWHKARWWNSFVRRRAWIRKRVKKDSGYMSESSQMLNPDYFTVRASSEISRERSANKSRLSMSTANGVDEGEKPDIEHVDELLRVLRASRIDREKIEAVENYLEHAQEDLEGLEKVMHEIMSLFVFQASRRVLLTRLTEISDQATAQKEKDKGKEVSEEVRRRADNIAEAVKHADEEVRRLEYWSDVKGMAEEGESTGAVDKKKGWDPSWQGVDNSGPSAPNPPPHSKDGNSLN